MAARAGGDGVPDLTWEVGRQARFDRGQGTLELEVAFEAIGGYNEQIPLDFADHDFCRRFAELYPTARILDLECRHGFADRQVAGLDQDLRRFAFFCRGARFASPGSLAAGGYLMSTLLRCGVLTARHRSSRFLPVMWRAFWAG